MKDQPNRLGTETHHRFAGTEIDRSKPIRFRLNGRWISGQAGDTVLSAVLASGILAAGEHAGSPLALDERFAPHVAARGERDERSAILPMARTPALDGLDLITSRTRPGGNLSDRLPRGLTPWVRSGPATLGHRFDEARELSGSWIDRVPESTLKADLVIVGGGIAGLSAAVAAGQKNNSVILVERRPYLGGDIRFFGSMEGEEPPEVIISGLLDRLARLPHVRLMTGTEAFALYDRAVRVHRVEQDGQTLKSQVLALASPRIILATGTVERLPIFSGNRLPGTSGALAAFHLADRYGVWPGRSAVITTSASEPYRLALLAQDAGIIVRRVADTRIQPQSRFVEYAKAYGIAQGPGLLPTETSLFNGEEGNLAVQFSVTVAGAAGAPPALHTDRLIASGGWQPDLTLWHMAGGASVWVPGPARLMPDGDVEGVLLAGSAAGYSTNWACIRSGHAATARLFARTLPRVEDRLIDPAFETPAAPTSVAPWSGNAAPAYLDFGVSMTARPASAEGSRLPLWPFNRKNGGGELAGQSRLLSIGDIAAAVQIGAIPEVDAAVVAQERSIITGDLVNAKRSEPSLLGKAPPAALPFPRFLAGRFGPEPKLIRVLPHDSRDLETGAFIHLSSSGTNPMDAVGVVVRPAGKSDAGALALVARHSAEPGAEIWVRHLGQMVRAKLTD